METLSTSFTLRKEAHSKLTKKLLKYWPEYLLYLYSKLLSYHIITP